MNINNQIQELWSYFEVQDDELLIVRAYNAEKKSDEYIIAEKLDGLLSVSVSDKQPEMSVEKPFQLIQHRDSTGKYRIPSVEQLEKTKMMDY